MVRIAEEARDGGAGDDGEVNLAMFYLYGESPQLLGFEAKDDAVRCQWLMRSIGYATQDVVPMPTQARALVSRA